MLLTVALFVIMMTSFTQGGFTTCPIPIRKHLTRCDQYIVCEIDEDGFQKDKVMDCPFGTLYDTVSGCVFPAQSDCLDRCKRPGNNGLKYKGVGNCRGYWECVNREPEARCCPPGIRFENGCTYPIDKNCNDICFGEAVSEPKPCDKIGSVDRKGFRQITSDGLQYFFCPSGSFYVEGDCSCNGTDPTPVQPDQCRPEVVIEVGPDGIIRDSSGNNYHVSSTGVEVQADKTVRFSGTGSINIQRLNDVDGLRYIKIAVTYTTMMNSPALEMAIVSNKCPKDKEHSILLTEEVSNSNTNTVRFKSITKEMSEAAYVTLNAGRRGEQKTVAYRVANGYLTGVVQNRQRTTPAPGPLKAIKCGLQIGSADGMPGFYGTIRDVTVYLCNPNAK